MISYPNPLQPPPAGATLPDQFKPLTQVAQARPQQAATGANSTRPALSTPSPSPSPWPSEVTVTSNVPTNSLSTGGLLTDPNAAPLPIPSAGNSTITDAGTAPSSLPSPDLNTSPSSGGLSSSAKAGAIAGTAVTLLILVTIAVVARRISAASKRQKRESNAA